MVLSESSMLRAAAVASLGRLGPAAKPAVGVIVEVLRDEWVHTYAVAALVEIGTPAVEPVIALLTDDDRYIRFFAAIILGRIGQDARSAASALVAALGDSTVVPWAAAALLRIGRRQAVARSVLTRLLASSIDEDWQEAALAVAFAGPTAEFAVPILGELVMTVGSIEAAMALGCVASADAVPVLASGLGADWDMFRETCAESLGLIAMANGDPSGSVRHALAGLANDESADVRNAGTAALARFVAGSGSPGCGGPS